ncbi:MAG: IS66 family insertion sequence element accessory protein TnpA [Acidobacteriota bacterium]
MRATGERVIERRRSRAEAWALVGEFEASGLSRQAFCAGRGLSVAALDKYRRQVAAATRGTARSERRLVAVEVMPRGAANRIGSSLLVELANGRRIEVGSEFDVETLQRLLSVLEQA